MQLYILADSGNEKKSEMARREYANAVHLFPAKESQWVTNVITTSSVNGNGLQESWDNIVSYFNQITLNGFYDSNRMNQNSRFLKSNLTEFISDEIEGDLELKNYFEKLEKDIKKGTISVTLAVELLYQAYIDSLKK